MRIVASSDATSGTADGATANEATSGTAVGATAVAAVVSAERRRLLLLLAVTLVSLVAALGGAFGPVVHGVAFATFGLAVMSAVWPIVAL
jgi:hypothetical protein